MRYDITFDCDNNRKVTFDGIINLHFNEGYITLYDYQRNKIVIPDSEYNKLTIYKITESEISF